MGGDEQAGWVPRGPRVDNILECLTTCSAKVHHGLRLVALRTAPNNAFETNAHFDGLCRLGTYLCVCVHVPPFSAALPYSVLIHQAVGSDVPLMVTHRLDQCTEGLVVMGKGSGAFVTYFNALLRVSNPVRSRLRHCWA